MGKIRRLAVDKSEAGADSQNAGKYASRATKTNKKIQRNYKAYQWIQAIPSYFR